MVLSRHLSLSSLRERRKTEAFFCPQCKQPVILKVGDVVIPHFAHRQHTTCRDSFSEGESPSHLLGKSQLYDWLSQHSDQVELEPYLQEIKQRPDLLVTWQGEEVPFEFQCSVIPVSKVVERNAGYSYMNMQPIWLLQTPQTYQSTRETILSIRLTRFQQFFIRNIQSRLQILLTYNPDREQFHYISHFVHLQGTSYAVRHLTLPLYHQTLPFQLPTVPEEDEIKRLSVQYISARRKHLRTVIQLNFRGIHHQFLRACYEMRVQPDKLPSWIGVPTDGQEAFTVPDCEWQGQLVAAGRRTGRMPHQLDSSFFHSFLKRFGDPDEKQLHACRSYINFLRNERIDIYRLDTNAGTDYVMPVLTGRFLAMHAKN